MRDRLRTFVKDWHRRGYPVCANELDALLQAKPLPAQQDLPPEAAKILRDNLSTLYDEAQAEPARAEWQPRSIALLRNTVSMLCHYVWHRRTRPGDHLWTIPVDKERDFDCILTDAIDEIEEWRTGKRSPPAAPPEREG